jgi:hypothetical protein
MLTACLTLRIMLLQIRVRIESIPKLAGFLFWHLLSWNGGIDLHYFLFPFQ